MPTIVVIVLLVVGAAVWVAVRGVLAKNHLQTAASLLPALEQQAKEGRAAASDVKALQRETAAARDLTADPIWSAATTLPWAGDDLAAVRAVARSADVVATQAVPALVSVANTLDPAKLRPKQGRIDLDPLRRAQAPLHRADVALADARSGIAPFVGTGAHAASLLGPVASAVDRLDSSLREISSQTSTGSRAADVLPAMLGGDGPRRYLVIFQNPAEARSLGGIAGAYAVVTADRGRLRIVGQGAGADFAKFDKPVLDLGRGARELYDDKASEYFVNVTQTIDFTQSARLARAMWQKRSEGRLDGVIATDPVALSYLLRATGPVTLTDGSRLTGDNAVDFLLSDVYERLQDPLQQNAYFAGAAMAVFTKLVSGSGDAGEVVDALARAGGERRLLVWSAHEGERARLAGTVLDGRLPQHEADRATIGVFINEGTASKMSYYMRTQASVTGTKCRRDGWRELQLDLTVRSTAPSSGLTSTVAGLRDPYVMKPVIYLAAPLRGGLSAVTVDGVRRQVGSQEVSGRLVSALTLKLRPGKRSQVRATFVVPVTVDDAALRLTPGVSTNIPVVRMADCLPV